MGAFFLYHRETEIDLKSVSRLYRAKGFSEPLMRAIGEYSLLLYSKQLIDVRNWFATKYDSIYACGSLVYKGQSYSESLSLLLSDFINNRIDESAIVGNYVLLFQSTSENKITLCADPSFIKNIYFDSTRRIISTDFLALLEASPRCYSMNYLALAENMITGSLISPDTYVNEIQKTDRVNFGEIERDFPGIRTVVFTPEVNGGFADFNGAVKHANEQLAGYFESVAGISDQYGANIGLTGGFDSRLLLMHARRHFKKLSTHSFWRPLSGEFRNAKHLARIAGLDFHTTENQPFKLPDKNSMLEKAYYFFDGQVRSQNRWDEEFNMPEYNKQMMAGSNVGFHGCGGEQYRNADRFARSMSISSFIKYEWLFRQSRDIFKDNHLKKKVVNNVEKKILRLLDLKGRKAGLAEMKRLQNEIWNTANRSTRINVLNQQQFYFAPFTEYAISHAAYYYVPYLGPSMQFEVEMMKNADPDLATAKNNYGINILEGETLQRRLFSWILSQLPRQVIYKFYFLLKHSRNKAKEENYDTDHPVIADLGEKMDLSKLNKNKMLGSSLRSFNYLLSRTQLKY